MSEKVSPLHPAEVLSEVGGSPDEVRVTLALYAQDLNPDDITKELGCAPTRTYPRGYRKSPRSAILPRGVWLLTLDGTAPVGPDVLISRLLDSLPREEEFWRSLLERYEVRINVSVHTAGWNRGFELRSETLARVAATGATLGFDLYMEGET